MKVQDLTGHLLDYWVAKALGIDAQLYRTVDQRTIVTIPPQEVIPGAVQMRDAFAPSTDWATGGPLLADLLKSGFGLWRYVDDEHVCSNVDIDELPYTRRWDEERVFETGETALVAIMRALVARKYGEDVPEVPQ